MQVTAKAIIKGEALTDERQQIEKKFDISNRHSQYIPDRAESVRT